MKMKKFIVCVRDINLDEFCGEYYAETSEVGDIVEVLCIDSEGADFWVKGNVSEVLGELV